LIQLYFDIEVLNFNIEVAKIQMLSKRAVGRTEETFKAAVLLRSSRAARSMSGVPARAQPCPGWAGRSCPHNKRIPLDYERKTPNFPPKFSA
jgi:hypothetical protein